MQIAEANTLNVNDDFSEVFDVVVRGLENGKTVYFSTAYKTTKVNKKHLPLLSLKSGHIYINKIDYSYSRITIQ